MTSSFLYSSYLSLLLYNMEAQSGPFSEVPDIDILAQSKAQTGQTPDSDVAQMWLGRVFGYGRKSLAEVKGKRFPAVTADWSAHSMTFAFEESFQRLDRRSLLSPGVWLSGVAVPQLCSVGVLPDREC